jgi:hypothetical protein
MSNSIDAILSQYEKNTQPAAGGNRISVKKDLKRTSPLFFLKGQPQDKRELEFYQQLTDQSPFKDSIPRSTSWW